MNNNHIIKSKIESSLNGGDALIIVPPFAGVDRPSIAGHLLQASCLTKGKKVDVLYANIVLASIIGEELYTSICYAPTTGLIGERFFSKVAYGIDSVQDKQDYSESSQIRTSKDINFTEHLEGYAAASNEVERFVSIVAQCIVDIGYRCVGSTSSFEQTSSSIAILSKVKELAPSIVTIMGGANCEGKMAEGVLTLGNSIDYVFSGESEDSFPKFLESINSNIFPENKVITGTKANLDSLAVSVWATTPSYA